MKTNLLLLLLVFPFAMGMAQKVSITGTVVSDVNGAALPGATVVLLNPSDSSTVAGMVTDTKGRFKIQGETGRKYLLQVQFLGFHPLYKRLDVKGTVNLGRLALKEGIKMLEEVEVIANPPISEKKGDTIQYNAAAFTTTQYAISQVLVEKMPGIMMQGGVLKAQGETVQQVLVDGKPFFGSDVNAALQNLPAEVVASVQVYDEKSEKAQLSGFEDGEEQKTINIVTKPDRRIGQFGKATAGYGIDDRYQLGTAMNFFNDDRRITVTGISNNINAVNYSAEPNSRGDIRAQDGIINTNNIGVNYNDDWGDNIEFSGSYDYSHRDNESTANQVRDYVLQSDSGQVYREQSMSNWINEDHRFRFRFDYDINDRNRLLIRPGISFKHDRNQSSFEGINSNNNGLINETENTSASNNSDYDYDGDIYYSHNFPKEDRSFSLGLEGGYHTNEDNGSRTATNIYYNAADSLEELNQQSKRNRTGLSWEIDVSYTEPIGKNGIVELEYEAENRMDDSDKLTYNLIEEETQTVSELDTGLSNTFESGYLTHQFELGYQFKKEKIRLQVEAEYEYAILNNDQQFPQPFELSRYFNSWQPSVRFDYEFNENESLEFDYYTWTREPSIGQLQDVIDNDNPLQLRVGNPDLKQSYQHWARLRYRGRNPDTEQSIYASIRFSMADNYLASSSFVAEEPMELGDGIILQEGAQLTRPVNVDGHWDTRAYFNIGRPLEIIQCNLGINGSIGYDQRPGIVNGEKNFSRSSNFRLGLSLSSDISEKIDFNVSTESSYNIVHNSLRPELNNNYFNQSSRFRSTWVFWQGLEYRADFNHQFNSGLSDEFDKSFFLLNMGLGKRILKDKRMKISVNVYDLLDQNNNLDRDVTEAYVEDSESLVLNRYFMLTITYNIRNFNEGTDIDDFDYDDRRRRRRW